MKLNVRTLLRAVFICALVSIIVVGCSSLGEKSNVHVTNTEAGSINKVVTASEVKWEPLNPARGDKSPQAGTLWGDRNDAVPTGFLAKFVDGFSSPPHIHNATYRAVVISGRIHNDDPAAANMWMPPGSFWTQPKGEAHITSAKGDDNLALVEIDEGPYLVLPSDEAFDSGERPINMDASNIVWVNPPGLPASDDGPKLAYLWGDVQGDQPNGTFIRVPAGFSGKIHSDGSVFRAVVIKGQLNYLGADVKLLEPGSYFSSEAESVHQISSTVNQDSVIYVHANGEYELTSNSA